MDKSITRLKTFEKKLIKSGILNFTQSLPSNAEVYLVGGIVRDILINRKKTGDIDLVIRNIKIENLEKILKKHGKVNFVGKNFGVFKFTPKPLNNQLSTINYQSIDIALPRTEHSFGTGAYKDFKINYNPKLPIKKDLSRRDFTINSIAYQLPCLPAGRSTINNKQSHLIDPYHGIKDLQNKTIRTVGNPRIRFSEDYSRMLRAIRIACELNFKIEEKTFKAIKKQMPRINDPADVTPHNCGGAYAGKTRRLVPYEIIASEILKSFSANPVLALDFMDKTGAIRELIPELLFLKNCPQPKEHHSEGDVWTHTRLALSLINSEKINKEFPTKKPSINYQSADIELILAVLFHDIGKPAAVKIDDNKVSFYNHSKVGAKISKNICKRLKFSAAPDFDINCKNIYSLVNKHMLYLYNHTSKLKNSTIAKYFLLNSEMGEKLQKLFWIDSMASVLLVGKRDFSDLKMLRKKIQSVQKQLKITQKNHLLTGHDIMKKFNIKPGPKIGKLLNIVHEAQLSNIIKNKKDAINFLKREIK